MLIWGAFGFGIITSFHCIGMCGPIALSLPLGQKTFWSRLVAAFLYNIGRATTYALLGAIFGLFGQGLQAISAQLQQGVSITFGVLMILSVLFPAIFRKVSAPKIFSKPLGYLKASLAKRFSNPRLSSLFTIGLLNGFLPCGPVYVAITAALASSSVAHGALYMFAFGIGTLPVMLALSIAGNFISINFRNTIRKIVPYVVVVIGMLFILRGMNLDIPMLSPKVKVQDENVVLDCCKKADIEDENSHQHLNE